MDSSKRTFDGTTDVKMFFFYFENVATRGKDHSEMALDLLAFLDRDPFQFYYEKFTRNGELIEEAKDYAKVKAAFITRYEKKEDPGTIMQLALQASLNHDDMEKSISRMDELFGKAKFNEEAKFAVLQRAVNEFSDLAAMALFRKADDYKTLKTIVEDFYQGKKAYLSLNRANYQAASNKVKFVDEKSAVDAKTPRIMVRPDARVQNVENKVDKLADQLANLTLLIKKTKTSDKGTAGSSRTKADDDVELCSVCNEPDCYAAKCPQNPHRNAICENCGKRGHTKTTCWSKKKKKEATETISVAVEEGTEDVDEISLAREEEDQGDAGSVGVVLEVDNSEAEDVMNIKRGSDIQPLPKNQKVGESTGPHIQDLLNPQSEMVPEKASKKAGCLLYTSDAADD